MVAVAAEPQKPSEKRDKRGLFPYTYAAGFPYAASYAAYPYAYTPAAYSAYPAYSAYSTPFTYSGVAAPIVASPFAYYG